MTLGVAFVRPNLGAAQAVHLAGEGNPDACAGGYAHDHGYKVVLMQRGASEYARDARREVKVVGGGCLLPVYFSRHGEMARPVGNLRIDFVHEIRGPDKRVGRYNLFCKHGGFQNAAYG